MSKTLTWKLRTRKRHRQASLIWASDAKWRGIKSWRQKTAGPGNASLVLQEVSSDVPSKDDLCAKLELSRVAIADQAGGQASGRGADRRARISGSHDVVGIEGFGAKLQADVFVQRRLLYDGEVQVVKRWETVNHLAHIAKGTRWH